MAVYRRGYQRYRGALAGHWTRFMVLPRFAWRKLYQMRLVALLTVVAMIWPLVCVAFIYLANHAELLRGLGNDIRNFVEVEGKFFLVFMNVQSVFAIFLAALVGPGLIAPDLENNSLPLYFSRPLTRTDYALTRLLVLVGVLSTVTWIPGVMLFGFQAGMAGMGWLRENWLLCFGMVAGFALWVLLVSLVAMASSAYLRWRIVSGALVLAFFFILAGISVMINGVFRVTWGHALNPAWSIYRLWCALLGVDPPEGPDTAACAAVLAGFALLLSLVLERKLRPVEVVK